MALIVGSPNIEYRIQFMPYNFEHFFYYYYFVVVVVVVFFFFFLPNLFLPLCSCYLNHLVKW